MITKNEKKFAIEACEFVLGMYDSIEISIRLDADIEVKKKLVINLCSELFRSHYFNFLFSRIDEIIIDEFKDFFDVPRIVTHHEYDKHNEHHRISFAAIKQYAEILLSILQK